MRATCLRSRIPVASLLALAALPAARAELNAEPYVAVGMFHDTNLVRLEDEEAALAQTGQSELADTWIDYLAGLDAEYNWSRQRFYLQGEATTSKYDTFTSADNDAWLVEAGVEGAIGSAIDHMLGYTYERGLAPFEYREDAVAVIETEKQADLAMNLRVTPNWQVEGEFTDRAYEAPQPDRPDFGLDESRYRGGVSYIGLASLSFGVGYEWLDGDYSGQPVETTFEQETAGVKIRYEAGTLSSLSVDFGYSQRDTTGERAGQFSGYTGELGYSRQISGKTTLTGALYRRVDSYEASAEYVVETGLRGSMDWAITGKTSLRATAGYGKRDFDSESTAEDDDGVVRADKLYDAGLALAYRPLRWLTVSPEVEYRSRDSNEEGASYDSTLFSLQMEARLFTKD